MDDFTLAIVVALTIACLIGFGGFFLVLNAKRGFAPSFKPVMQPVKIDANAMKYL